MKNTNYKYAHGMNTPKHPGHDQSPLSRAAAVRNWHKLRLRGAKAFVCRTPYLSTREADRILGILNRAERRIDTIKPMRVALL